MKNTKFTLQLRPSDLIGCDDVVLFLNSPTPKYIGTINHSGEGTFQTVREIKHLYRNLNSIGINQHLLFDEENFPFKWILIKYCGKPLVTSRKYFQRDGIPYCANGYESQYLLNLDLFGIEKARKFEQELSEKQFGLFSEVSNG